MLNNQLVGMRLLPFSAECGAVKLNQVRLCHTG